jgi:hypothetical protein
MKSCNKGGVVVIKSRRKELVFISANIGDIKQICTFPIGNSERNIGALKLRYR